MNRFIIPRRRHGNWINNIFFLFIIVKFVVIDWPWLLLLLLFLEPAEAKEENKRPYSVVHTNNIALDNDAVRIHEPNGIVENTRR
jgi:hypothetical protein